MPARAAYRCFRQGRRNRADGRCPRRGRRQPATRSCRSSHSRLDLLQARSVTRSIRFAVVQPRRFTRRRLGCAANPPEADRGLAMDAAAVRSFVRGEVADVDTELPEDAIPLWQSRVRLILVTAAGCQPCELQKRSMPDDVRYETFEIEKVNEAGYKIRTTPTLMVFVDGKLEDTSSGLLRGDRLRAFLDRWGFTDNETQPDDADRSDDDLNPWSNPRRWNRGPIRDRIDDAKDRFAWWLVGKWLAFAGGGAAVLFPWLFFLYRALRKMRSSYSDGCPIIQRTKQQKRSSPKRPRKRFARPRRSTKH